MVIIKKNIHIIRYGISLKFTENTILNRQKKTEEKYILNTILNRLNPYNYRRKRSPWLYWLWTPPQISMAPSGTSIGGARGHQTPPRRHLPRLRLRQVLGHRGAGGAEKAGEISAGKHRKPWEKRGFWSFLLVKNLGISWKWSMVRPWFWKCWEGLLGSILILRYSNMMFFSKGWWWTIANCLLMFTGDFPAMFHWSYWSESASCSVVDGHCGA